MDPSLTSNSHPHHHNYIPSSSSSSLSKPIVSLNPDFYYPHFEQTTIINQQLPTIETNNVISLVDVSKSANHNNNNSPSTKYHHRHLPSFHQILQNSSSSHRGNGGGYHHANSKKFWDSPPPSIAPILMVTNTTNSDLPSSEQLIDEDLPSPLPLEELEEKFAEFFDEDEFSSMRYYRNEYQNNSMSVEAFVDGIMGLLNQKIQINNSDHHQIKYSILDYLERFMIRPEDQDRFHELCHHKSTHHHILKPMVEDLDSEVDVDYYLNYYHSIPRCQIIGSIPNDEQQLHGPTFRHRASFNSDQSLMPPNNNLSSSTSYHQKNFMSRRHSSAPTASDSANLSGFYHSHHHRDSLSSVTTATTTNSRTTGAFFSINTNSVISSTAAACVGDIRRRSIPATIISKTNNHHHHNNNPRQSPQLQSQQKQSSTGTTATAISTTTASTNAFHHVISHQTTEDNRSFANVGRGHGHDIIVMDSSSPVVQAGTIISSSNSSLNTTSSPSCSKRKGSNSSFALPPITTTAAEPINPESIIIESGNEDLILIENDVAEEDKDPSLPKVTTATCIDQHQLLHVPITNELIVGDGELLNDESWFHSHLPVRRHRSLPAPTFISSSMHSVPQQQRSSSFRSNNRLIHQEPNGHWRVKVKKTKPFLGIAIEGGSNVSSQSQPRIINIQDNGAAAESLHVGYIILEVDGQSTQMMNHGQVAQMIARAYYNTPEKDYVEFLVREKSRNEFDLRRSSFMLLNNSFE